MIVVLGLRINKRVSKSEQMLASIDLHLFFIKAENLLADERRYLRTRTVHKYGGGG